MKPSGVLWKGPSPVDGAPLVAISTYAKSDREANAKTGRMAQIYILRDDISPVEAVRSGQDVSACGHCPMRSPDGFSGRGCYVNVGNGPASVWKAYKAGKYGSGFLSAKAFSGVHVRWGAYGDPAMLPQIIFEGINDVCLSSLGYTHQWKHPWAQWSLGHFMASVETASQETAARLSGWGTFRVGLMDSSDLGNSILCRNERDGTKCVDCGECDGGPKSIYIPAHGIMAKNVPAERLVRSKRAV